MPYKNPERQAAYQAGYLQGVRRAWLDAHGPCVQCGSSVDLEVDHIEGASKDTHRVWSWSKERREVELAKCQVLCRACHREKSAAALRKPLRHGTLHGYKKCRCRCDECRSAAVGYERARRARLEAAP